MIDIKKIILIQEIMKEIKEILETIEITKITKIIKTIVIIEVTEKEIEILINNIQKISRKIFRRDGSVEKVVVKIKK